MGEWAIDALRDTRRGASRHRNPSGAEFPLLGGRSPARVWAVRIRTEIWGFEGELRQRTERDRAVSDAL